MKIDKKIFVYNMQLMSGTRFSLFTDTTTELTWRKRFSLRAHAPQERLLIWSVITIKNKSLIMAFKYAVSAFKYSVVKFKYAVSAFKYSIVIANIRSFEIQIFKYSIFNCTLILVDSKHCPATV